MPLFSKKPTISEIHQALQNGESVAKIIQHFTDFSRQVDPQIEAVFAYTETKTKQQIGNLEAIIVEYKAKFSGDYWPQIFKDYPLFAVPFFVKSIIQVEGEIFNASSKILDGFKATFSATPYLNCVQAGAVLLGSVKMDEFACGASGETSAYGPTKNPYDLDRVPGGSSSGSVAVVASGQAVFALGSETGGSIRQPAAFTGTVGLKPTYGLVSRYGTMPMASSLDQVGPVTNCIEDSIVVTAVLSGQDEKDQTSLNSNNLQERLTQLHSSAKNYLENKQKFKIGIPKEFYIEGIEPQILEAMLKLRAKLEDAGHEIVDISLPLIKYAISVYYTIMPVELAANLERLDGVRYALQPNSEEMYFDNRHNFGDEIKRRIMLGTYSSSAGYYDAYYNQAQKVRFLAYQDFQQAFTKCDVMLTPTTPEFPFKIGQKSNDPLQMYLSDVFTCGINPVRIPGLNIPLGDFEVEDQQKNIHKLPSGCQLLAPELMEDKLFKLGLEIENLVTKNQL